ncbi:MAG: Ppx/GppA family phosphatase [Candidatus Eisenbacteria bacterium]|nr:Ppx/GppA family phosphatase [Candidatus Eisenbacteria bacterium]
MRIAALDIGTNSIHMVIADTTPLGTFEVFDREREVVQIGRGSFDDGRLRAEQIQRTSQALARFCDLARRHDVDTILCTATAAVREARNGGAFLRAARRASGVSPRVIPAEEEGRLIYLAVRAAIQLDEAPALIVDIGGGSMQLVVGTRDRLLLATCAPVGALRLNELLEPADPPAHDDLARMRRRVRRHTAEALERVREWKPTRVYGCSGSIHALAQAAHWKDTGQALEHVNEFALTYEALQRTTRRLARMTTREREALPGIDAQRAEIILPGAVVLEHVLESLDAPAIVLSDYGVREGIVTDYIGRHGREISRLAAVADLPLRSVLGLLGKLSADGPHPQHVTLLALALYDELHVIHELPDEARALLHYAALLHDAGTAIGHDGHLDHSYYIIRNGGLRGLSAEAIEIVACVARYHGRRRPRKRDEAYAALAPAARRTVRWLAGLLRIAEALDRSHYQLVRALRVTRRHRGISILVSTRHDARLEIWAARRRTALLERLIGGSVRVAVDPSADTRRRVAAPAETRPAAAANGAPLRATNGAATRPAPPPISARAADRARAARRPPAARAGSAARRTPTRGA